MVGITDVRMAGRIFIALAVMIGFSVSSEVFAQKGPCAGDIEQFCKDVQPGQGRIVKCMKEHEKDLSPGCKAHVAEMKKKMGEVQEACADDAARFCSGVQQGGGRIMRCLKEHENDLTPPCKAKMQEHRQRKDQ
jgi:hypothetical protein